MTNPLQLKELKDKLSDRWWRLNNLYYIKDERGERVLFKPDRRVAQKMLYENMWFFNIVPKARQLGITTFFTIFYLDQVLFSNNKTAVIIAHAEKYMKDIFRDKVKFAWDNLNPWIKETIGKPNTDSANELTFPNGSMISVALSSRGRTLNFLHISEFGKICAKYPDKAKEIVTGAINSVHPGNFVSIESTAEGKDGYFYDFCMEAEKTRREGKKLTKMDFKIFFFPWYIDPRYKMEGEDGEGVVIDQESKEYFKKLAEKEGIVLTLEQQKWYVKKKALNKGEMLQEYPSTLEECFQASIEGQVFKDEMKMIYNDGRIRPVQHDPGFEVDTWWDLGWSDLTVILLTQSIGGQIRVIDMYWNRRKPLEHYYDWLKERKELMQYRYNAHHLPHDAAVTDLNEGVSRQEKLYRLGLYNIQVGKKLDIMEGIDHVRGLLTKFYIDEERCKKLHEALFNYRYEYDAKLGFDKKKPLHDMSSHFCFVGDTEIETKEGLKKIKDIKPGEYVRSASGWTKVVASGPTGIKKVVDFLGIKSTPNHPVLTQKGFVPVDTVSIGDRILVCKDQREKMSNMTGLSLEDTRNPIVESAGFIFNLLNRTRQAVRSNDYIGTSGRNIMVPFLKEWLFIIKTGIQLIINWRTLSVLTVGSTNQNMHSNQQDKNKVEKTSRKQWKQQESGTKIHQRVLRFIVKELNLGGRTGKEQSKSVRTAVKNIQPSLLVVRDFATQGVNKDSIPKKRKVYNLATESGSYLVNGIVVSNCDPLRLMPQFLRDDKSYYATEYEREMAKKEEETSFFG